MKKVTKMGLMLCLVLSGTFCQAHGVARQESEKGKEIVIDIKAKVLHGGADRSSSIQASIDGHILAIVFTENLGQVNIDITTDSGATVNYNSMNTPNGVNYYIPNTGSYIVYFTLSNGDQYYGEFEVTD